MTFINNTAETDGAAIYATDIFRCVYTPTLDKVNSSTVFEESIFQIPSLFKFRYSYINFNNIIELLCTSIAHLP